MFVAVVLPHDNESELPSGDMRCFVAENKDDAITAALNARDEWGERRPSRRYYVAVGELHYRVEPKKAKRKYKALPLESETN